MKLRLGLLSVLFLFSCEGGYGALVKKKTLMDADCPNNKLRLHIWETKRSGRYKTIYNVTILPEGIKGNFPGREEKFYPESDFIMLYAGSLGSVPEGVEFKIVCSENGKEVFDAGVIEYEKGFCFENSTETFYYLLEGLAEGGSRYNCFPDGMRYVEFHKK